MKTLVIHPADPTTTFLSRIYVHLNDKTVVTYKTKLKKTSIHLFKFKQRSVDDNTTLMLHMMILYYIFHLINI